MGNRTKSLTELEQSTRDQSINLQSKRLKMLTKEHRVSIKELAYILDRDRSMVGFYKSGKHPLPYELAEKLSDWLKQNKGIDIVPYYLTGETDLKTWVEWRQAESEGMSAAEDEIERKYKARVLGLTTFFRMCGFDYENIERTSLWDFSGIGTFPECKPEDIPTGPHRVSKDGRQYYFSEEELNKLVESIGETVGFACYKKELEKE